MSGSSGYFANNNNNLNKFPASSIPGSSTSTSRANRRSNFNTPSVASLLNASNANIYEIASNKNYNNNNRIDRNVIKNRSTKNVTNRGLLKNRGLKNGGFIKREVQNRAKSSPVYVYDYPDNRRQRARLWLSLLRPALLQYRGTARRPVYYVPSFSYRLR